MVSLGVFIFLSLLGIMVSVYHVTEYGRLEPEPYFLGKLAMFLFWVLYLVMFAVLLILRLVILNESL